MEHAIALREWAVAIHALESGRQIIVLRKGGIAEETKEFKLESSRFYLFPSYEHQRSLLVKPEVRAQVESGPTARGEQPSMVRITSYAEVVEDIEVTDLATLKRLDELHIWTEDYAEERLKWKKAKPLHVLILRVYQLSKPIELPIRESYGGCKSWLYLEEIVTQQGAPVLSDEQFEKKVAEVRKQVKA